VGSGGKGRDGPAGGFGDSWVSGAPIVEGSHAERQREGDRQRKRHRRGQRRNRVGRWLRRYAPLLAAAAIVVVAVGFGARGQGPLGQIDAVRRLGGEDVAEAPPATTAPTTTAAPTTTPGDPAITGDPATSTTSTTITLRNVTDAPGDCLTWDQTPGGPGNRASTTVPCDSEHLFEVTGAFEIDGAPYGPQGPTEAEWEAVQEAECRPRAAAHLGYELDPHGRFWPSSIQPTPEGWSAGQRRVVCGISAHATTALAVAFGQSTPFVGVVAGADQTFLYPVGTCLGGPDVVPGENLGTLVDCAEPHTVEIVGTADVISLGPAHPGGQAIAGHVDEACRRAAEAVYGGPLLAGIDSGNMTIEDTSWNAGQRLTECILFASGPDGRPMVQPNLLRFG
jgi:hypothetical protein